MAKIRKTFKVYEDLAYARDAVEELIEIYGEHAVLGDILINVKENEAKWEDCSFCKGSGLITKAALRTFVSCPVCKGMKHTRIKKQKEAKT